MAAADVAYINPKILTWAVDRSRLSRAEIAGRVKVPEERVRAWERDEFPPFKKARDLAKVLQFPFGYFFLPEPPNEELPIPDFRRLAKGYRPTQEFQQLLNDSLVRLVP